MYPEIIGNGEIARVFRSLAFDSQVLIFASGVSNSSCKNVKEFERERLLLESCLKKYRNYKFVYFSSCFLSLNCNSNSSQYYKHKLNMEGLIKQKSPDYLIVRLPQVFGRYEASKVTLLNYLTNALLTGVKVNLNIGATRYLIATWDVGKLVNYMINQSLVSSNSIIDVGATTEYSVFEIKENIELITGKKLCYETSNFNDRYNLEFDEFKKIIPLNFMPELFDSSYLSRRLPKFLCKENRSDSNIRKLV